MIISHAELQSSQQTRDVGPMFVKCWPNVTDGGSTLTQHLARSRRINPLTAKLFNLNFHPLEVVSR